VRLDGDGRVEVLRDSVVRQIGLRDGPADAADGVLILTQAAVGNGKVTYLGSNVTSFRDMSRLERVLEPRLREERLRSQGAPPGVIAAAAISLDMQATKVTEGQTTGVSSEASFFLAYIINFLMYMTLLLYGIQVMSAVIEEKSNRIVEVLVSSMTPFQLLMGKVIGVGAVGLVQIGIWGATGFYVTSLFKGDSAASAGVAVDGTARSMTLPSVSPDLVLVVLVFFLLGFFLYSSLYAAIGAMCNTQQEAQQANTPITMLIGLGMLSMFALINEPSGSMARVLSFIPFFTPIVVPVRYAIAPLPLSEVLLAVAVMLLGIAGTVWLAARIYRVGVLSYGKRPTLKELWRWARTA
jgi:ABC-2 type transport system permease protein